MAHVEKVGAEEETEIEFLQAEREPEPWEDFHSTFADELAYDQSYIDEDQERGWRVHREHLVEDIGDQLQQREYSNLPEADRVTTSAVNNLDRVAQEYQVRIRSLEEERQRFIDDRAKLLEQLDKAKGRGNRLAGEKRSLQKEMGGWRGKSKREQDRSLREASVLEMVLDRIPPSDTTLEQSLLAIYLRDPTKLESGVNQKYVNKMFYADDHRLIHVAMSLVGQGLDRRTLVAKLIQAGSFEVVGGQANLRRIFQESETVNPEAHDNYVDLLEQYFLRREMIFWSTERLKEAYSGDIVVADGKGEKGRPRTKTVPVDDWVDHLRRMSDGMYDMLPYAHRRTFHTKIVVDNVLEEFAELKKRGGRPRVSTGYEGLDRITYGVCPGQLIVFGATTKTGKTTVSLNIADNVARQGYSSLVFTYENAPSSLVQKLIGRRTGLDTKTFRYWDDGTLPDGHEEKIRAAASEIRGKLPIYFDSQRPADINYILAKTRSMKAMHPNLALVCIDALNSFPADRYTSRTDTYYNHLTRLNDLAQELGITMVVNAQLKRDSDKPGHRPTKVSELADCKGAGDVASHVILLYRPEKYIELSDKPEYKGWVEVIPAALREGFERGKEFRLGYNRFTSNVYSLAK